MRAPAREVPYQQDIAIRTDKRAQAVNRDRGMIGPDLHYIPTGLCQGFQREPVEAESTGDPDIPAPDSYPTRMLPHRPSIRVLKQAGTDRDALGMADKHEYRLFPADPD